METPNHIEVRPDGAVVSAGTVIARPGPEHAIQMAIALITSGVRQSLITPTPVDSADALEERSDA